MGGKTRELPLISQLLPNHFQRIVEPFCGGAAVSFSLYKNSVLNDLNQEIINLYLIISNEQSYQKLQKEIDCLKTLEHNELEIEYYKAREYINQSWKNTDTYQRALSYVIVRQLCFSGMERYNSKGEFNVPFGHYKKFSCNLKPDHHHFLKTKSLLLNQSFETIFDIIHENDFIFIDPPYLERLGYGNGDSEYKLHQKLLECLKITKSKWLLVHSYHDFYLDNYKDFNIISKDFCYAQIFGKNKNHSGAKVKHLYIRNYGS